MSHTWTVVLTTSVWILALAWLRQSVIVAVGMRRLPHVGPATAIPPVNARRPDEFDLTVIVPACNEEASIAASLASLVSSKGIRLQIIAVNDRSTDGTAEIMNRFAAGQASSADAHSIQVLHIGSLPTGWLGKTHAMHLAAEQARSPWILFTDADVLFAPDALCRILTCADALGSDHFVMVPTHIHQGFSEAVMMAVMHALDQWAVRYWKVSEPGSKEFLGVGGFNMIRREAFRALGGFSRLRLEVIEDMSLGWMVKRAGYRSQVALGHGLVRIRWIEGAFGVVRNIEKNGFAMFRFRGWLCILAIFGLLIQIVLPLAGIAIGGWARVAGLLIYAAIGAVFYFNRKIEPTPPLAAIFFAPCVAILCIGFARSMFLTLWRDGVIWRGTHYKLAELREGAASWK